MRRPSWDEYFLQLVDEVASRSTCDRGRSGCVIVIDKRILCTGYVGSPPGMAHCDDVGHLLRKMVDEEGHVTQHCVRTIHAEQNAIIQAARFGVSISGAVMYCTMEPCRTCAMSIIGSGIKKVVCRKKYHASRETKVMFSNCGVELAVLSNKVATYKNM